MQYVITIWMTPKCCFMHNTPQHNKTIQTICGLVDTPPNFWRNYKYNLQLFWWNTNYKYFEETLLQGGQISIILLHVFPKATTGVPSPCSLTGIPHRSYPGRFLIGCCWKWGPLRTASQNWATLRTPPSMYVHLYIFESRHERKKWEKRGNIVHPHNHPPWIYKTTCRWETSYIVTF